MFADNNPNAPDLSPLKEGAPEVCKIMKRMHHMFARCYFGCTSPNLPQKDIKLLNDEHALTHIQYDYRNRMMNGIL